MRNLHKETNVCVHIRFVTFKGSYKDRNMSKVNKQDHQSCLCSFLCVSLCEANGGDLLPPQTGRTGACLRCGLTLEIKSEPCVILNLRTSSVANTHGKDLTPSPPSGDNAEAHLQREANLADLMEATRNFTAKMCPLFKCSSVDAVWMECGAAITIFVLSVKVTHLRMQSKACVKTCGAMPCSCCRIRHCSRVTDMAVRSLALLQLVKRTPFSRRQI